MLSVTMGWLIGPYSIMAVTISKLEWKRSNGNYTRQSQALVRTRINRIARGAGGGASLLEPRDPANSGLPRITFTGRSLPLARPPPAAASRGTRAARGDRRTGRYRNPP